MALTALQRGDDRTGALKGVLGDLLGIVQARDHLAGLVSGLDIHYDLGGEHPLVGRRMPDLDVVTASGPLRVYTLLHRARPALISFGGPDLPGLGGWADRVQLIDATYDGAWELPLLGDVAAPAAVLVRPDGHVAWVGDQRRWGSRTRSRPGSGPPDQPRHGSVDTERGVP